MVADTGETDGNRIAGRWVAQLGDVLKLIYSGDPSKLNEQHKKW
jgi:hypothetical protein